MDRYTLTFSPGRYVMEVELSDESESYKRMWAAVVEQAFIDAKCNSKKPKARQDKIHAIKWLVGGGKAFEDVCQKAGLSPEKVYAEAVKLYG